MSLRSTLLGVVERFQDLAGPSGLFEAAQRYRAQRRFADAEECYAKAARLYATRLGMSDPHRVAALAGQAYSMVAMGRFSEARILYEEALEAKLANGDTRAPMAETLRQSVADARNQERGAAL